MKNFNILFLFKMYGFLFYIYLSYIAFSCEFDRYGPRSTIEFTTKLTNIMMYFISNFLFKYSDSQYNTLYNALQHYLLLRENDLKYTNYFTVLSILYDSRLL